MTVDVVIKAQSVGGKKNGNSGTTVSTSPAVLTDMVAGGDKERHVPAGERDAATGKLSDAHPQNFSVQTPATLLLGPFGIALSIHDNVGQRGSARAVSSRSRRSRFPAAQHVDTPGNPFYDGTTNPPAVNPFSWTMSAHYSPPFKNHTASSTSRTAAAWPTCSRAARVSAARRRLPSQSCWDHQDQDNGRRLLTADGQGLETGILATARPDRQ